MARAQFQKGQKVWVECVGVWTRIEKVQPVWAKGFEEPVRITYDVGLGREFVATELSIAQHDGPPAGAAGAWRLLRARNKWQALEDCVHHPYPGTYPVVVTDDAEWGGWRVPGAEYDRDPALIEFQARTIATAPALLVLARAILDDVAEAPQDAPPQMRRLAEMARPLIKYIENDAQVPFATVGEGSEARPLASHAA